MAVTIVRESRAQALIRFHGCIGFVAVAVWGAQVIPDLKSDALLYLCAAFFGVLALRYLWPLCHPGALTIGPDGITQNLGWRRLHWTWNDIDRTEVIQTPGGLTSACLVYPRSGGRVRLFGWAISAEDIQRKVDTYRPA